jgi:hypothetical protein
MSNRSRCLVVILAVVASVSVFGDTFAQSQATTYNLTLSHAEASVDESGRIVVTMMASGDLQGTVTVRLDRSAEGAVTGEWAFNVSYTEVMAVVPNGTGDEDPGEALVQKGVLKGSVKGGSIALNDDGSVRALSSLLLELKAGTLEYESVTAGDGLLNGTDVSNRDASNGSISLTF